ncbi:carbon-nitrogen family hydrolase [Evansella halocellulosilytica]|uniref:carbon-nitrogen family hydrolase n=1 Tax=Evansella halocellulosilytica TaxID=2011013 RepID=UPI000BB6DCF9|nr:carbon-nitrogen family hydrolase [Evansella halocellulosilytica]
MNIAAYQMDIMNGEPAKNRKKVERWIADVRAKGKADILVLPEMWTTAYTLTELEHLAENEEEVTLTFLKTLALKHDVHLVAGSIATKVNDDIFNRAYVINDKGKLIYHYDKIHLVPMLDEPRYLTGGKKQVQSFELNGVKMGVIICFDLRFPEITRQLALEGVEVLFVLGEWPAARKDHWTTLLKARAIENQMYVISSNRIGSYNNVEFAGNSMIVDPWGEVIIQGSDDQEETLLASIETEKVKAVRKDVPVFKCRVPSLYTKSKKDHR